jgi:hypothetical protein
MGHFLRLSGFGNRFFLYKLLAINFLLKSKAQDNGGLGFTYFNLSLNMRRLEINTHTVFIVTDSALSDFGLFRKLNCPVNILRISDSGVRNYLIPDTKM